MDSGQHALFVGRFVLEHLVVSVVVFINAVISFLAIGDDLAARRYVFVNKG